MTSTRNPIVIGAGPAGLTAALRLAQRGATPRVFEASETVGGLARTPRVGDWRIDPGGHRFFTRSEEVQELWNSLLPPDQWIATPRRSAMLVDGRFVQYPLVGRELLMELGVQRAVHGLASLVGSRARRWNRPVAASDSFREWGTREFGRYWYTLFFDGYVRKTWLTEPDAIASDWANQRIKPIDWRMRRSPTSAGEDVFRYPRLGPGQVWEAAAAALAGFGVRPSMNSQIVRIGFDGWEWTVETADGEVASGDAVFSSMPLRLLVDALEPKAPKRVRHAAASLKHRGIITVAVALRAPFDFPYHWVYTPGPGFHVGRIQNYRRWSRGLAPAGWDGTFLGFEYFVGPGGSLLSADDETLMRLVIEDLHTLGVTDPVMEVITVVRSRYAYPISGPAGDDGVARIRHHLQREYPSLYPIGRNGMHRYDNQDHAMLSAMHSVDRYFGEDVDPWQVNVDRGYHETGLLKG